MHRQVGDRTWSARDSWPCPGRSRVSRRGMLRLAMGFMAAGCVPARAGWGLPGELHQAQEPRQPTPFERLHLPTLRMPSFTRNGAHVPLVVEMEHPMEPEHYITSLQVLNASDPISSKGVFYLTPANGQAYLAV